MRTRRAWLLLVVPALAYPLTVLVGGTPHFPSRGECVRPATEGAEIEAVLAYRNSERSAAVALERALSVGFTQAEMIRDACGRVKVVIPEIPTLGVGRAFAAEARKVGFRVTLEQAG